MGKLIDNSNLYVTYDISRYTIWILSQDTIQYDNSILVSLLSISCFNSNLVLRQCKQLSLLIDGLYHIQSVLLCPSGLILLHMVFVPSSAL